MAGNCEVGGGNMEVIFCDLCVVFDFGGVCVFRDLLGGGSVHFNSISSGLAPCNELTLRAEAGTNGRDLGWN